MTTIVHFSDWHGKRVQLPAADIYVCTGDMYDNFPLAAVIADDGVCIEYLDPEKFPDTRIPKKYKIIGRKIDHQHETDNQREWAKTNQLRPILGNPDAPVVLCRGNHDFYPLSNLFEGCNTWEIDRDSSRTTEILGMKFGGMRGINKLEYEWSDEFDPHELEEIAVQIPDDIDCLVTHSPPQGVLDKFSHSLGATALMRYTNRRTYNSAKPLRFHFFGHIHESRGSKKLGETVFSNAAKTYMLYNV